MLEKTKKRRGGLYRWWEKARTTEAARAKDLGL